MALSNLPRTEAIFCDNDSQCLVFAPVCKLRNQVAYCVVSLHICMCKNPDVNVSGKNNDGH